MCIRDRIKTRFSDANKNDQYQIELINPNDSDKIIDTSNIISTIDLTKVIAWFNTIKIEVTGQQGIANSIQNLIFPNISAAGDAHFDGKTWEQFKAALKSFGVNLQFRALTKNNINDPDRDWVDNQNGLTTYDPTIGKIQVRFKFENQKALNIKMQLDNGLVAGTDTKPTKGFDIQLKVKLMFEIDRDIVSQFITSKDVITGNTKILKINANAEKLMIEAIKQANAQNNPEFAQANLKVGYQLGDGAIGGDWKILADFEKALADASEDQDTNKVVFYFFIEANQNDQFETPNQIHTLHNKEIPGPGIQIPYYINAGQWEDKAQQIIITGTSSNLSWNFDNVFDAQTLVEEQGKVYLKNATGEKALQVYFTTNANANYDSPDLSDNPAELSQKWVAIKPTNLNAGTKNLKIKLVALPGFVYEPAEKQTAAAHDVQITIKREIIVDKNWFKQQPLTNSEIEISAFSNNLQRINAWEEQVYEQIAAENQIDLATAQNVKIEYFYGGQNTRLKSANALLEHIKQLMNNFGLPSMGLVQLWDGFRGDQIKAIFVSGNEEFILKVANNPNPTENDLKELVDTTKIYTSISLVKYIQELEQTKTQVELKQNGNPGEITSFTPVSYTHLTLPTTVGPCRSRWSPYH